MTYSTLIQQLVEVNSLGGIKLGLSNVLRLQQLLNYPDRTFISIHVAGTNGKGSVSTKIAHAFQAAGYRTGLYTSPHLSSFRERICIDGKMISEEAIENYLPSLFQLVKDENIPATFFELTTFLAFHHFAENQVDVAIIETGLGGRLDATNCVTPCLSVITSISLEHTEILGNTLEEITREKGGIIKDHVPVLIGPRVPTELIAEIAEQRNSPLIRVKEHSPLFEIENQMIARAALNFLADSFDLSPENIARGLEAKQPCRFEIAGNSPTVILDVAHNPDGLEHLFRMIEHSYPGCPVRMIFGLSKCKDLQGCVETVAKHAQQIHLVTAPNGRGVMPEVLFEALVGQGRNSGGIFIHASIHEAVEEAKREAARHEEILVICGTCFIMGEARKALGYREPCDTIDLNERGYSIAARC